MRLLSTMQSVGDAYFSAETLLEAINADTASCTARRRVAQSRDSVAPPVKVEVGGGASGDTVDVGGVRVKVEVWGSKYDAVEATLGSVVAAVL